MSAKGPTRREEHAQARREQILNTALDLFAQHGFAGTTTKQIAQTIDITEGLLYHYFSSKNALFAEIVQRIYAVGTNLVQSLMGTEDRPVAEIMPQFGIAGLRIMRQQSALLGLVMSESQFNVEVYHTWTNMFREITSPLVAYLERRVVVGEIRADMDIHVIVDAFTGAIFFFYLNHRTLSDSEWQQESERFIERWFIAWYEGIATSHGK